MSVPQKGHFRLSALSQLTVSLICLPHLEHVSSSGKLSKNIVWLQTINKISSVGKARPNYRANSECSKNDRASGSRTEVIIREICSQLVGQERCEHVVYAVSQKRLLGAMYHVSAFRPRVCNRSHVCVCVWTWLQFAFRVCRCAYSILSAGTRRRFRTSLSFDSVQMSHLVGSNCQGFTPLR